MISSISGFPEFLPEEQLFFTETLRTIYYQFERYGFVCMDTPLVERVETLLSKGNSHEIYGIHRLASEEEEKTKLALRFDLTVPLARYVAQHCGKLTFPYKRYHIGPVFRGERPQKGRYRQFYQCDIDVVDTENLASEYESEILCIAFEVLKALNISHISIEVNNRKILSGLFQTWEIPEDVWNDILRILDKVDKMPAHTWWAAIQAFNLSEDALQLLKTFKECITWSIEDLEQIHGSILYKKGVEELRYFIDTAIAFGVPKGALCIRPLLARGLTYYTGNLCEIKWLDHPELGTICAGGRYDNLVQGLSESYIPGFGLSVGISRLIETLYTRSLELTPPLKTPTLVFITRQPKDSVPALWNIAQTLRDLKISTEVALMHTSLKNQMKYAHNKGIRYTLIRSDIPECWELRNMQTGDQIRCVEATLLEDIMRIIRSFQ